MVSVKIFGLYSSVWEPVFSNDLTGKDLIEFSNNLSKLRETLCCSVCDELLTTREALSPSKCLEHFVCKACKGKERNANRKCQRCEDWDTYGEDEELNNILRSYQGLCFCFLTNDHSTRVLEVKHEVDPNFNPDTLLNLLTEGLKGLPKGAKRKLHLNPDQNRGVVPLDIPRKRKKTCSKATGIDADIFALEKDLGTNDQAEISKVDAIKLTNDTPQEKTSSPKTASDTKVTSKTTTVTVSSSSTPAVKLSTPTTNKISQPEPLQLTTFASTIQPVATAIRTPPLVQIKVEVPTPTKSTPEKHQYQNDGNGSQAFTTTFSRADPLQDPLGEEQSRSLPKAGFSVPRPVVSAQISSCNPTTTLPYRIASPPVVSSQSNLGTHQIIQIAHPTGIKTVSIRPQQFRLAGIPGRIPVQILGPATSSATGPGPSNSINENIRLPIITNTTTGPGSSTGAPTVKRRIIFTTATPHDLQRWPDANKVLQFATGDFSRFPALAAAGIRQSLISVGQTSCPIPGLRVTSSASTARPVVTSAATVSLVRPPNSSTVVTSSASPVYHTVSDVGSSSTHGTPIYSPSVQFIRTVAPTSAASVGSFVQPQGYTSSPTTITRQVPVSSLSTLNPIIQLKRKSEGCRCGNATPTPGKLTCIGQRCACYADRNACSDCKCKGCKNPYVPGSGGKKVLHGVRTLLDHPHTNQAFPIMGHGSSTATVLTSNPSATTMSSSTPLVTTVGPSGGSYGPSPTGGPISSSVAQPMPPFQLIPVRFGPTGAPQYLQISNPHALQQMPFILSTSGNMHTNSSGTGITIQGIPVSGLSAAGLHQISQFQQSRLSQPQQVNIKTEGHKQHE